MQKLLIFQSLWAMERRHTDGHERSLDENIAMISAAGFDGISAHYTNRRDVLRLNETIRGTGLKIEGVCFPRCGFVNCGLRILNPARPRQAQLNRGPQGFLSEQSL
jgi:hypothetical protein